MDESGSLRNGNDPPSYSSPPENSDPPTYTSVMAELRNAKKNSTGRVDFLKNVCGILTNTICFAVLIGIFIVIPILMIIVGALNLNHCPVQRFIPIWLVTAGAIGLFQQMSSFIERVIKLCKRNSDDDKPSTTLSIFKIFMGLLGCFNFAWFIAGSVWVYAIYHPNTYSSHEPFYCDHLTYYLAFGVLTVVYVLIALICFFSCCIICLAGSACA